MLLVEVHDFFSAVNLTCRNVFINHRQRIGIDLLRLVEDQAASSSTSRRISPGDVELIEFSSVEAQCRTSLCTRGHPWSTSESVAFLHDER
jgi:hypothetical protein